MLCKYLLLQQSSEVFLVNNYKYLRGKHFQIYTYTVIVPPCSDAFCRTCSTKFSSVYKCSYLFCVTVIYFQQMRGHKLSQKISDIYFQNPWKQVTAQFEIWICPRNCYLLLFVITFIFLFSAFLCKMFFFIMRTYHDLSWNWFRKQHDGHQNKHDPLKMSQNQQLRHVLQDKKEIIQFCLNKLKNNMNLAIKCQHLILVLPIS